LGLGIGLLSRIGGLFSVCLSLDVSEYLRNLDVLLRGHRLNESPLLCLVSFDLAQPFVRLVDGFLHPDDAFLEFVQAANQIFGHVCDTLQFLGRTTKSHTGTVTSVTVWGFRRVVGLFLWPGEMEHMSGTLAARVGAGLCLIALGLLLIPYSVLDGGEISVYYGIGPVSPLYLIVLPPVTAIALLGADRGRSDPAMAAGASVAVTTLFVLFVGLWTLGVGDVVGGLTVGTEFAYHRWALLGVACTLELTVGVFAWHTLSTEVPQGP
jgi:hypothetical protein